LLIAAGAIAVSNSLIKSIFEYRAARYCQMLWIAA